MSAGWVTKWRRRLREQGTRPLEEVVWSQSRRPHQGGVKVTTALMDKVVSLREEPPLGLQRTPGCETIYAYLRDSPEVKSGALPLVCPKTINTILHQRGCIVTKEKREHEPLPRAAPMQAWAMDFKDVTTVKGEQTDKRMHQVETLNVIDCGTSILIANPARLDFTAETVIGTLAQIFEREGLPQQLTFDRDPRFVGGAERGRDFPSPLVRFLNVLGVEPDICPPRQPFKNPFAERVNRTYKYEGILVYLPEDLTQTEDMNHDFRHHYNYQRPHQGVSCGNQPPRVAFPDLPTLPALPDTVDPDSWLTHYDGLTFLRRVNPNGSVVVDRRYYYVGQALKGEQVALQLVAQQQGLKVLHNQQTIKTLPLKGLVGHPLPWADYLTLIQQEARSDWQAYLRRHRRYLPLLP